MKTLTIRGITKQFIIEPGRIYSLNIENINYYHKLATALFIEDNETFILFKDTSILDFIKETLFINDLYTCSPNNKKILNALYKKIKENPPASINDDELVIINNSIIEILKKIELDIDLDVDYETEIELTSLLTLYKFCFKEDYESNIQKLITFIKANLEIRKISLIISLNILPLFNENDIKLLSKELELLGIALININLSSKSKTNTVEYTTIDDDLCEF